jgi:uracil-DNA glycosylase
MTWNEILTPVLSTPRMRELQAFLKSERQNKKIYPEGKDVFRAFDLCTYEQTKVVILGQDPYPWEGVADGLAFSSRKKEWPKSLEVIFKEIYQDLNIQYFHNVTIEEFFPTADLTNWTKLGILLLNVVLTVEENKSGSHKGKGWELVIEEVFKALDKKEHQVIYLLWGRDAQEYQQYIKNPKHVVLTAPHPAAELYKDSNGTDKFTGCRHFSIVRDILPMINKSNIYNQVDLDSCFDKAKAKAIVREHYPIEADKICNYIDKDLILHIPVNRDNYFNYLHEIEAAFSTKPQKQS